MSFALMLAGMLMVGGGTVLFGRSVTRLRRAGVMRSLFWASLREYWTYRRRALRPLPGAVLGVLLIVIGLTAGYLGVTAFYADRLGRIGP
jgi:hypothetical protein